MTAWYNEIDPYAAQWLRNLIDAGHIAPGVVDERSIKDVRPEDLRGFKQCHFFAGIGVWSHALRLAGWPDDRPVWTGSCPCQPFSAAGKRGGTDDERHLWPDFFRLISECAPGVVLGEQVASKDGLGWLDAVYADLEGAGYAVGALDLCAAGVGAPHIRQRLWFVAERLADAGRERDERVRGPVAAHGAARATEGEAQQRQWGGVAAGAGGASGGVGHHHHQGLPARERAPVVRERGGEEGGTTLQSSRASGGVADDDDDDGRSRLEAPRVHGRRDGAGRGEAEEGGADGALGDDAVRCGEHGGAGPTHGHWRAADWLWCRDGRWRPVMPGTFPLVDGAPARVGRLRAYGNAIVAPLAAEFIAAYMSRDNDDRP